MAIGESITGAIGVTHSSISYAPGTWTIDGVSPVNQKWEDGLVPVLEVASGIDIFTFSVIKTAAATFTLLKSFKTFR